MVGIAGLNAWQHRQPAPTQAPAARTADPEAERTRVVQRYLKAPNDAALREEALAILRDDAINLGATTDAAHLPTLARLLKSDDPGLRAAAARAMALIGPTPAQTADLLELLKDPQAEVSSAARQALSESFDPAARAAVDPDRR